MSDVHDAIHKTLQSMLQRQLAAEARTEAAIGMLRLLYTKDTVLSDREFFDTLKKMQDAALQEILVRAEDVDPRLASELDPRPPPFEGGSSGR